jgi:hypothetical protein
MVKKHNNKKLSVEILIDVLLKTDIYHTEHVIKTNFNLNNSIMNYLKNNPTSKNKHIYMEIKQVTDNLAVLAQAALMQPIIVRSSSAKQFEKIQYQLKSLKSKLNHNKKG